MEQSGYGAQDAVAIKSPGFRVTFFIIRIVLGAALFEAGVTQGLSGSFSAADYLSNATGPLAPFFTGLAQNAGLLVILNNLVIWGEILVGAALILGLFLRFASFWGAIMMILYYLPYLPAANGIFAQQVVYLSVFIALMFSGIGYFIGLDLLLVRAEQVKHPLRYLLG